MLSSELLTLLRDYFVEFKPVFFLFEGQKGNQYGARSAQQVLKQSQTKARIKKDGSVRTLRQRFATHLIANRTDVHFVQELLDHNSIKSTMIHAHLTDITKRKIASLFNVCKSFIF